MLVWNKDSSDGDGERAGAVVDADFDKIVDTVVHAFVDTVVEAIVDVYVDIRADVELMLMAIMLSAGFAGGYQNGVSGPCTRIQIWLVTSSLVRYVCALPHFEHL